MTLLVDVMHGLELEAGIDMADVTETRTGVHDDDAGICHNLFPFS